MSKTLDVTIHGERAGVLTDVGNAQIQFQYFQEYVEQGGLALSQSLPLTEDIYDDAVARPFFSGVLPDDQQLDQLANHLKVSKRNVFKLLREVGGECAGAVSIIDPAWHALSSESNELREISDKELLRLFQVSSQRPILGGDDNIRLSLAGAQSKLAVVIEDGRYFLSGPTRPSTHILKPGSKMVEGLVYNEYFCMQLAANAGLSVPATHLLEVGDQHVYQVARYDRIQESDQIRRVHQEDFCQALCVVPENKYEFEGGPTLSNCFALLQNASSRPVLDYQRLLERVIFNYLIGNNDAHAKNFSLIYSDGSCRLAPAYDLVSTAIYEQLNSKMAMKIGGRALADDLQLRHWERLVPDTRTAKSVIHGIVTDTCNRVAAALESTVQFITSYRAGEDAILEISDLVQRRVKRLLQLVDS